MKGLTRVGNKTKLDSTRFDDFNGGKNWFSEFNRDGTTTNDVPRRGRLVTVTDITENIHGKLFDDRVRYAR